MPRLDGEQACMGGGGLHGHQQGRDHQCEQDGTRANEERIMADKGNQDSRTRSSQVPPCPLSLR
jgi:hypothetical protein